jgi:hypothetical protein
MLPVIVVPTVDRAARLRPLLRPSLKNLPNRLKPIKDRA